MKIPRIRLWFAAGIAAMVGAAGTLTTTSAQAAIGCRVDYQVTNQWPGGFGANVIVNNLGDPINGWKLTWSFPAGQTITELWNGTYTQSGSQVTVTNEIGRAASPAVAAPTSGSTGAGTAPTPCRRASP